MLYFNNLRFVVRYNDSRRCVVHTTIALVVRTYNYSCRNDLLYYIMHNSACCTSVCSTQRVVHVVRRNNNYSTSGCATTTTAVEVVNPTTKGVAVSTTSPK